MNAFNPELCVKRKTKSEHYDIKDVRRFAKAAGFTSQNLKLGKQALCDRLKQKYRNEAGPANRNAAGPANRNAAGPSILRLQKKGKNRNALLASRSPLALNIRKNPKQFKNNIKLCIKQKKVSTKTRQTQRTIVKKNLMKYFKNRNYKYKPIANQLSIAQRNPLDFNIYNRYIRIAVLLQFGEIKINDIGNHDRAGVKKVNDDIFMRAVIEYQNFRNNPKVQIQSIEVPRTWNPSIGRKQYKLNNYEKDLMCSIRRGKKLYLNTIVYIKSEIINDTINYVYDLNNLIKHMKNKGYCPEQPWKQLTPNNIKFFSKRFISNLDIDVQGLLYVRELQKIQNSNILITVEKMLTKVHTINNRHILVIHARNTNNVKERRGNCGSAVIELYDYIQEQKSIVDKKNILSELGESLPVCIEAKCNFIREFVEMKRLINKGEIRPFNYNSGITKDGNISNAVLFFINKWCGEAAKKAKPREYFLGKLPDLFTRVQTLLQNKNATNGKIDYRDILQFILDNGEYMLNCGNLNFDNINLNTENKKRFLFGMRGIR